MRCKKCGETAVIQMRQYKLTLCGDDFVDLFQAQTERFIGKYKMFTREDRVLVAVSGGKDSLALWEVLLALGYQADGLTIGSGIDGGLGYSDRSLAHVEAFLANRSEVTLHGVDVAEVYGASIPETARLTRRGRVKSRARSVAW